MSEIEKSSAKTCKRIEDAVRPPIQVHEADPQHIRVENNTVIDQFGPVSGVYFNDYSETLSERELCARIVETAQVNMSELARKALAEMIRNQT